MSENKKNFLKLNITNLRNVISGKEDINKVKIELNKGYIPYQVIYKAIELATSLEINKGNTIKSFNTSVSNALFDTIILGYMTNMDNSTVFSGQTDSLVDRLFEFIDIAEYIGALDKIESETSNYKKAKEMLYQQMQLDLASNNSMTNVLANIPTGDELQDVSDGIKDMVDTLNIVTEYTHPTEKED